MAASERDPGAWLLEQSLAGVIQEDIAAKLNGGVLERLMALKQWLTGHIDECDAGQAKEGNRKKGEEVSQPTISRNLPQARNRKRLTQSVEEAILAVFACEDEIDSLTDDWQFFFLACMDALQEWKALEEFNDEQARLRIQREDAARRAFEDRQERARSACKAVNDFLKAKGFMAPGQSYIWGDGHYFFSEGIFDFAYATEGAKIVGFAEPDFMFDCRLTAGELREGITAEQRMQPTAVPAGEPRPRLIGLRDALDILTDQYPDGPWFWEEHFRDIIRWHELRDQTPAWWNERVLPRRPDDSDIAWYREVLELETKLLSRGFTFEGSILRWGGDWRSRVKQERKVLQTLRWRRVYSDSGSAVLRTAAWAAGATASAVFFWKVVIPFLFTLGRGIIGRFEDVLDYSVASFENAFLDYETAGEWVADATLVIITSLVAFWAFLTISVFLICTTTALAFIDRRRSPEYGWSLALLSFFIVLTVVTGVSSVVRRLFID